MGSVVSYFKRFYRWAVEKLDQLGKGLADALRNMVSSLKKLLFTAEQAGYLYVFHSLVMQILIILQ